MIISDSTMEALVAVAEREAREAREEGERRVDRDLAAAIATRSYECDEPVDYCARDASRRLAVSVSFLARRLPAEDKAELLALLRSL